MIDKIDDTVKQLLDALPPGFSAVETELSQSFKSILQSVFSQLDLVTREEFDTQIKVLARTREKLSAMERQMAELEKKSS